MLNNVQAVWRGQTGKGEIVMHLTNKERFTRCAFGQEIDMLPIQCDFSGRGLRQFLARKGITNVSDLELLPFFDNHVLYAYMNGATLRLKTKDSRGEASIRDEWGVDWDTDQDLYYISHPLEDWDALESYVFPDPMAPGYLDYAEDLVRRYGETHIVTAYHFCTLFERAYMLRGFENLMTDFYLEEELLEELLDRITEFQVALAKRYVSIGVNCGRTVDDYGTQNALMISPALWRRFIKPRLARIIAVYRNAGLPVIHHSCGAIQPLVGDLIEIGVNVLNPIQPKVLDLPKLVEDYGDKLTFFGGICNQEVLPFRTPEEVEENVQEMTALLGKNGRYIIAPSNGIGTDVPQENIDAYFRAAERCRRI